MSTLEAVNLHKVFKGGGLLGKTTIDAVKGFNLTMELESAPRITTLAGESGSGKSTIARMILGFLRPTLGDVFFSGKSIWELNKNEWMEYRRNVQPVFQDPYSTYNPFYRVGHALTLPVKNFALASNRAETNELLSKALEAVGLEPGEVLDKYPYELSGGQQQRVQLARALLVNPRCIIADEPVSMIDASLRTNILNTMNDMKEKYGISYLLISHDLSIAYYVSDDIKILYRGVVVEEGDIEDVVKNPLHPYTQELIESIPIPDPEKRWSVEGEIRVKASVEVASGRKEGCEFLDRCPRAMDVCRERKPTFVQKGRNHQVACHLLA